MPAPRKVDNVEKLKEAAIEAALKMCDRVINGQDQHPEKTMEVVTGLISALKD